MAQREEEDYPDELEERLVNEEYKIWKKNTPFLYGGRPLMSRLLRLIWIVRQSVATPVAEVPDKLCALQTWSSRMHWSGPASPCSGCRCAPRCRASCSECQQPRTCLHLRELHSAACPHPDTLAQPGRTLADAALVCAGHARFPSHLAPARQTQVAASCGHQSVKHLRLTRRTRCRTAAAS